MTYMMWSATHGRGEQGATPSRATTSFVTPEKNGAAREVPARSRTVERLLIDGIALVKLWCGIALEDFIWNGWSWLWNDC